MLNGLRHALRGATFFAALAVLQIPSAALAQPSGGVSASYPADIRAGAGFKIQKQGLSLRISADYSNVPLLTNTPAAGNVLVQDPATGEFNRLDLSNLPTTVPQNGSVTLQKFSAIPAFSFIGNATGATAQPQYLAPSQAKSALALDQVNNTADADKPVSTAQAAALNTKAPVNNLTFTGTATAPSIALTGSGSTGDGSGFTVKTTTVPGGRALSNFLNAPDFATPDTFDGSTKGATTAYVQNFWKQRNGNTVSPYDYCTAPCGRGSTNDTVAVQAALNAAQALQAAGVPLPVIDLRGGMFAVNAALTTTGAPYGITIQNGGVVPFNGYTGIFFDFSGTTATTDLRFYNLVLNGYGTASTLIKMGPKTQGTFVEHCRLFGYTYAGFWDPSTVAGTENRIVNNVFQGGNDTNVGTAIILSGNDSEIRGNLIRNSATGIQTLAASHAIFQNHIYTAIASSPVSAITASTGDQLQIYDNYIDTSYLYINDPSNVQINSNKFLMVGQNVSGFTPIILRPTSANYTLKGVAVRDNIFRSLLSVYDPVRVDTSAGTIGAVNQTDMTHNTFDGFNKMSTEPVGRGVASNAGFVSFNFAPFIPWGSLKRIWGGTLNPSSGTAYVQGQTISGTVGFLQFSATASGEWSVRGSVNDDPPF